MEDTPQPFDAASTRANTPGVASVLHLNAASAALPSATVVAAIKAHLDLEARIGLQASAERAQDGLAIARQRAATLLGCRADQIVFGSTCAQLWSLMFHARKLPKGGRILVSRGEWGGNLLAIEAVARDLGISVETMPTDGTGRIDTEQLKTRLDDDVRLLAVTEVSSVSGIRQPVAGIGALDRPQGCLYFIDAAQAIGRFPLALEQVRADVVTAPARKWLRGPRGQALAALSDAALAQLTTPPLLDLSGFSWSDAGHPVLRADAHRFDTSDYSIAGRLGFGAALGELLDAGPKTIANTIDDRIRTLRTALAGCETITVHEPADSDAAFLTFDCAGLRPADLVQALAREGIAIASQLRAYAPRELDARGRQAVLRTSPHAYNSPDEIARFAEVLRRVSAGLRKAGRTAG